MARTFAKSSSGSLYVNSALVTSPPFTMACWAWANNDTQQHLLWGLASGSDDYLFIDMAGNEGDSVHAYSGADGDNSRATSSATFTANTWIHLCGVWAAADSRAIYVNGGNKGTNTDTRNTVGLNQTFLSPPDGSALDGRIAEAAIWNVVLTDAEVALLALGHSPLFVRPESLVCYLPLIRDNDEDLIGGVSFTTNGSPGIAEHPRIIYPSSPGIFSLGAGTPPVGGAFINTIYVSQPPKLRATL